MIIKNNQNKIRLKCEKVLEHEVKDLVEKLESALDQSSLDGYPGVGLAAPQIGIAKSISIVRHGKYVINLVNPIIEKVYDKILFKNEGCLSFPEMSEDTIRYNEVHIKNDYSNDFVASGFLAVICQHEIDHLNETLFFDKKLPANFKRLISSGRIKPDDNCPCGSLNPHTKKQNKFKKCCGEIDAR